MLQSVSLTYLDPLHSKKILSLMTNHASSYPLNLVTRHVHIATACCHNGRRFKIKQSILLLLHSSLLLFKVPSINAWRWYSQASSQVTSSATYLPLCWKTHQWRLSRSLLRDACHQRGHLLTLGKRVSARLSVVASPWMYRMCCLWSLPLF